MADRIDALGDRRGHLTGFTGSVTSRDPDTELQQIVRTAAKAARAPIALVSLVLSRTQFFRAHFGLPRDLEVAQATDRDASFCQFVVRDGDVFEVSDATADDRVPQELVDQYGIRAYLGIPVSANDRVLGSLCVLDTVPRTFTSDEHEHLVQLAERVSVRLDELAAHVPSKAAQLVDTATRPVFPEIRNAMTPIVASLHQLRAACADLTPLAHLAHADLAPEHLSRTLTCLRSSRLAVEDLVEISQDLDEQVERVRRGLEALSSALHPMPSTQAHVAWQSAVVLAQHTARLVGGVQSPQLPEGITLACPSTLAVSVLSTAVSGIASHAVESRTTSGVSVYTTVTVDHVVFRLSAEGIKQQAYVQLSNMLESLTAHATPVKVDSSGQEIALHFKRSSADKQSAS